MEGFNKRMSFQRFRSVCVRVCACSCVSVCINECI